MSEEATNAAEGEAPEAEVADAPEVDQIETGAETEGDGDAVQPEEPEDDLEEVEWEGKKARIPPEFKAALMRTADYTQKTQALAETRKTLEAKEQSVAQQVAAAEAVAKELGQLARVETEIEAYDKLTDADWAAVKEANRDEWQDHKERYRDLKAAREQLSADVKSKKESLALEAKRTADAAFATQIQERNTVLARDIKGWGPDLAAKVIAHANKEFGITPEELQVATDPRVVKVIFAAMQGAEALSKQKAAARVQAAQQTTPVKTVGGASPNARKTTDASGDGLSMAEWAARERAREAERRKRA